MTPEQKNTLLRLTRSGKSEKEIAAILSVHRNTVYRVQKSLGLSLKRHGPRTPEISSRVETKIICALQAGVSQRQAAAFFHVRESAVRAIAKKAGIKRRPAIPLELRARIAEEISARRNYARDIAGKFGISYKAALRFAHELLASPEFRRGRVEPLTSNFPQRYFPKGVLTFQHLAQQILDRTFDGEIPEGASAEMFCDAAMRAIPVLSEARPEDRKLFAENLLPALQSQIAMRSLSAGPWVN